MPLRIKSRWFDMPMRAKAGWITVVLWLGTLVALAYGGDELTLGAFLRTAVVMTLLYLAWPQLERLPRWLYFSVPAAGLIAAFQPRLLILLVPPLLLYGFIRPKPKKEH